MRIFGWSKGSGFGNGGRLCRLQILAGLVFPALFTLTTAIPVPSPVYTSSEAPAVIAHRGASHKAPENTMTAIELAWAQGADAVEVDVRMTADSQVVIIHDESTGRTAERDLAVRETPFDTLKQLDVGAWKSDSFRNERIPELAQALPTIPEGKRLYVEVKEGPELLPLIHRAFKAHDVEDRVAVIGFDHETMRKAVEQMPGIPVFWVVGWPKDKSSLVKKARNGGFTGLTLRKNLVTEKMAQKVLKNELSLLTWTVNDTTRAKKLSDRGVEGITTDRPGVMLELYAD